MAEMKANRIIDTCLLKIKGELEIQARGQQINDEFDQSFSLALDGIQNYLDSRPMVIPNPVTSEWYRNEYLQSIHWQNIREEKLRASDDMCNLCASKDRLEVHHRTYDRLGCELMKDLIVLCHKCHQKFHQEIENNMPQYRCIDCGSADLKDKGSFDKCMNCGKRITTDEDFYYA